MSGPLVWGVAGRALPGQAESGDRCVVWPRPSGALVAVIDGLGHGAEAAVASRTAARVLEAHAAEDLPALLARCHEALRRTRGAVLSLASFDTATSTMSWAGVGNVEAVLLRASGAAYPSRVAFASRGGVVGSRLPPVRVVELPISYGDTLVVATDGLRSGFASGASVHDDPRASADALLAAHARDTDDACVLVARYVGEPSPYVSLPLHDASDVVMARKHARQLAARIGLDEVGAIAFATAVSEVARNVIVHAGSGELVVAVLSGGDRDGVVAVARDEGPGIGMPELALEDGWTTGTSLGLGLPSARRLVDELDLVTTVGVGTTVTLRKWAR